MIEELRILAEIVGDLTAIGGWLAAGYIAYKFFLTAAGFYLCWKLAKAVLDLLSAPLSVEAVARYKQKIRSLEDDVARLEKSEREANAKSDRYAHMYAIMKEKRDEPK